MVVTDLEGIEATAYSIADNRTTDLSAFEPDALGRLLKELRAEDALDGVGYGTDEIDALLAELAHSTKADVEDPGPGEPSENPIARTGRAGNAGCRTARAGCGRTVICTRERCSTASR